MQNINNQKMTNEQEMMMIIDSIDEEENENDKCQIIDDNLSFGSESSIVNFSINNNDSYDENLEDLNGFFSSFNNNNSSNISHNEQFLKQGSSYINFFLNKKRNSASMDETQPSSSCHMNNNNKSYNKKFNNSNKYIINIENKNDELFEKNKINPIRISNFMKNLYLSNVTTNNNAEKIKAIKKKLTFFNSAYLNQIKDEIIDDIYPYYKNAKICELIQLLLNEKKYRLIFNNDGIKFLEEIMSFYNCINPKIKHILQMKTETLVEIYNNRINNGDKKFRNKIDLENKQNDLLFEQ